MSNGLNLGQVDPAILEHLPSTFVFGTKDPFIFAGLLTIVALLIGETSIER